MTLVEDVRRQVQDRLRELKPLVEEYQQLEAMAASISGSSTPPAQTRRARPAAQSNGAGRRGRRRGTGTRASEALELVRARPGISIPELAEAMGIKQNYLYRVMPGLANEGKVTREGRGWRAVD